MPLGGVWRYLATETVTLFTPSAGISDFPKYNSCPILLNMSAPPDILAHVPFIALILCYALGSALYIGLADWSRSIARGQYNGYNAFHTIFPWIKAALITVILASLMRQIADHPYDLRGYLTEIVLLTLSAFAFYLKLRTVNTGVERPPIMQNLMLFLKRVAAYCFLTLALWALLIAVFLTSFWGLQIINAAVPMAINTAQTAIIITGLLSLWPFVVWYNKAQNRGRSGQITIPERYRFHSILWPYILGLLLFILPLFLDKVASSDKFKQMINASPALQRV